MYLFLTLADKELFLEENCVLAYSRYPPIERGLQNIFLLYIFFVSLFSSLPVLKYKGKQ